MSARTIFNPAKLLSMRTRTAIREAGVILDNYVSNIENKLRSRGLSELADIMLSECDEHLHAERNDQGQRSVYRLSRHS